MRLGRVAALAIAIALAGCAGEETRRLERDNPLRAIPRPPLGFSLDLSSLPVPPTPERVRLGRWLFFDRRLSANGTVSCATCHQPGNAFSQRTPVATGVNGMLGRRKVPPIINVGVPPRPSNFQRAPRGAFFWDGRASSLERQALEPIANPIEMASSHTALAATLAGIRGYGHYFAAAFGDPSITIERVAQAIADYERTRMSGNSPFDRWHSGGDQHAVSDAAKRGYELFVGRGQCAHCHATDVFGGGGFHNTGIGWDPVTRTRADEGRYAVTRGTADEDWPGTFKSPTLREVSLHPPYMHDGSIPTLRAVVEFYNRGGNPNPDLSAFIHPLGLTAQEMDALVAFLTTLNGEGWQDEGPRRFPR